MDDIHLSVVAASRNDDHGGRLLYRMQHFVSGFIKQCQRHGLRAELILVEWNPPEDRPPLAEVLEFPDDPSPCSIRIIQVPPELHQKIDHSDKLPLFQMIAKNVGIRRARGKYVLATNIDILFSDELICYMRDKLKPGRCYRADRLDIPGELPDEASFDELMIFCRDNYFRINGKYGTRMKEGGKWRYIDTYGHPKHLYILWLKKVWAAFRGDKGVKSKKASRLKQIKSTLLKMMSGEVGFVEACKIRFRDFSNLGLRLKQLMKLLAVGITSLKELFENRFHLNLHTNGCGDFTLMAMEDWKRLKGYPELQGFSWHIDSYLVYQAAISDIKQIELPIDQSVYHIEHAVGSGFTPEDPDAMFRKLERIKLPFISYAGLLSEVEKMKAKKKKKQDFFYNKESWGFDKEGLKEIQLS